MRRLPFVILCLIILPAQIVGSVVDEQVVSLKAIQTGPYIDEIRYKVILNDTLRVQQLINGGIEMSTSFFDLSHLPDVQAEKDVEIISQPRNGYEQIIINCLKYPLNITGFRRAFAYAYNKTRVLEEVCEGYGFEHDSIIPNTSRFCIENDLPIHYYTAQPEIGNVILDLLNFTVNPETGYRLTPDGAPLNIDIWWNGDIKKQRTALIGVEALNSLNIQARATQIFFEYTPQFHWNFDMFVSEENFYDDNVGWLAFKYWSENAIGDVKNPSGFRNATYDLWRDQLLHGETYEKVYEAAAEMQRILHYNVPTLVTCENIYIQGYRTDQFEGHVEDRMQYISGPWTLRNIHRINGSAGGSVTIGMNSDPRSFNIFHYRDGFWTGGLKSMLEIQYSSLFDYGPDSLPVPDLAEDWVVETHDDNVLIPDGYLRYTIDIIQNATWSDDVPLTAEDVAFTLNYAYSVDSDPETEEQDWIFNHLHAAYAPNPYRIVIEYSSESFWHFSAFAYLKIIPRHIFSNEPFVSQLEWDEWNPVFNTKHPLVTSGPFEFTGFDELLEGEYSFECYTFSFNPDFYYAPQSPTSVSTTTNENGLTPEWIFAIMFGSMFVIVIFIGEFIRVSRDR